MTTTAGNGPFPSGTHTYSFISSPSTLMLSQNDAMVQPSPSDQHVCHGNVVAYFFPQDRSASMGRRSVGVKVSIRKSGISTSGLVCATHPSGPVTHVASPQIYKSLL